MIKKIFKEKIVYILIGLAIGIIFTLIIMPKKIAKLSDGSEEVVSVGSYQISADEYYKILKNQDKIELLLRHINVLLCKEKYPNQENDAQDYADHKYRDISKQMELYNVNEEEFLKEYSFADKNEMLEFLKDDYYLNKYYESKLAERYTNDELKDIYNSSYFATKNVYVFSSANSTSDLKKIKKDLDKGKSLSSVLSKYSSVSYNEIEVDFMMNTYGNDFLSTVKGTKVGKTSSILSNDLFGNYLVYVEKEFDQEDFEDVRGKIVDSKSDEIVQQEPNIMYKVMIDLQKENNISFKDQLIKEEYEKYVKEYYK